MPTLDAPPKNAQAKKFRVAAKHRLLEREMTVGQLARELGASRNGVSAAINHSCFPLLLKRIRQFLNLP